MANLKIYSLGKMFYKRVLTCTHGTLGTHLTVRWPCEPIISSTRHFEFVQLKYNWTGGEGLLASDQEAVREWRLLLFKGQWRFLQYLISKIIRFEKKFNDGVLSLYTGCSGNSSGYQMALKTNYFTDWTVLDSNWSPVEQVVEGLLASDQSQFYNEG